MDWAIVEDAAYLMARRALPENVERRIVGELAKHIEDWLPTFTDEFLEKNLPVWMGEEK
jgi:hypothetical protein